MSEVDTVKGPDRYRTATMMGAQIVSAADEFHPRLPSIQNQRHSIPVSCHQISRHQQRQSVKTGRYSASQISRSHAEQQQTCSKNTEATDTQYTQLECPLPP